MGMRILVFYPEDGEVYPIRNFGGALAAQALAQRVIPRRDYLECSSAAEQRGVISNMGVSFDYFLGP